MNERRTVNRNARLTADLRRIIATYAHFDEGRYRRVRLCTPRAVEVAMHPPAGCREWSGHTGKICYPTAEAAADAAAEIAALPGADHVAPYLCPRGEHWHHVSITRRSRTSGAIAGQIHAAVLRAAARQSAAAQ